MTLCLYFKCRQGYPIRFDCKDQQDADKKLKDVLTNGVWVLSFYYPPNQLDYAELKQ